MFADQCDPSTKMKLKGTKRYVKAHNVQYVIKILDVVSIFSCGVEDTPKSNMVHDGGQQAPLHILHE